MSGYDHLTRYHICYFALRMGSAGTFDNVPCRLGKKKVMNALKQEGSVVLVSIEG